MCRAALTAAAAALIALVAAGNAGAATPQTIYRDLADNGRLDGTYSRAEIERAFGSNSSIPSYARPLVGEPQRTPQMVRRAPAEASSGESRASLPFSGLDAALLAAVSAPLLLLGGGMRHLARSHAGKVT
jgi:hypothetical protein